MHPATTPFSLSCERSTAIISDPIDKPSQPAPPDLGLTVEWEVVAKPISFVVTTSVHGETDEVESPQPNIEAPTGRL